MNNSNGAALPPNGAIPPTGEILRAGASGAAIAGTWTAIYETVRVRNNEITADEAIQATAKSAVVGAGAGAVAHLASHIARSVPMIGLAALAIGAVYFASASHAPAAHKAEPQPEPEHKN